MKKEIKEEIKKLKATAKKVGKAKDLHSALDFLYERITNDESKKHYNETYNVVDILDAKTLKELELKINKTEEVVFEFVEYKPAPQEFLIIYNEFENHEQTFIDIYITKERTNG